MSEPGLGSEGSEPRSCAMGNLMPWQRLETAAKVAEEAFRWQWWQTEGLTTMVGPEWSKNKKEYYETLELLNEWFNTNLEEN